MKATEIQNALNFPAAARVEQRVPKKLLVENGAPTAADKRLINEGVEEIYWLAALKPTTIGIPEFGDEFREYLEIAVLRVTLRPLAKAARISELVHRGVPYPVFLMIQQADSLIISLAHKRWAQNEAGKIVLDGDPVEVDFREPQSVDNEIRSQFVAALSLTRQPSTHLFTLYQGWVDTILALQAARLTGTFTTATNNEQAIARRRALQECLALEGRIESLRSAASKEKQINRQVDLNLEIKRLQAAHAAARAKL